MKYFVYIWQWTLPLPGHFLCNPWLPIHLDRWAKSANGNNSFSTKIDYTKACIRCCMYVNYDWNNSTVKTVLQFMCLDDVGVRRAYAYIGCPVFPLSLHITFTPWFLKFENARWMCAVVNASRVASATCECVEKRCKVVAKLLESQNVVS